MIHTHTLTLTLTLYSECQYTNLEERRRTVRREITVQPLNNHGDPPRLIYQGQVSGFALVVVSYER